MDTSPCAISSPRPRRSIMYKISDDHMSEIGLWFDVNLLRIRSADSVFEPTSLKEMIRFISQQWTALELAQARLFFVEIFLGKEKLKDRDEILEKVISEFIEDANEVCAKIESTNAIKLDIFDRTLTILKRELRILKLFANSKMRIEDELWVDFVQTIQRINFYGFSFDLRAKFDEATQRSPLGTQFIDTILRRINTIIDMKIPDELLSAFLGSIILVNPSKDFSGKIVENGLQIMDHLCLFGSVGIETQVGTLHADHIKLEVAIRCRHDFRHFSMCPFITFYFCASTKYFEDDASFSDHMSEVDHVELSAEFLSTVSIFINFYTSTIYL